MKPSQTLDDSSKIAIIKYFIIEIGTFVFEFVSFNF